MNQPNHIAQVHGQATAQAVEQGVDVSGGVQQSSPQVGETSSAFGVSESVEVGVGTDAEMDTVQAAKPEAMATEAGVTLELSKPSTISMVSTNADAMVTQSVSATQASAAWPHLHKLALHLMSRPPPRLPAVRHSSVRR